MGVFPPPGYPVCSQISIRLYDSFGDGWYGHVSGTGKVEPPSKINFTNAVTGAPIIGACIAGACVQNSWQYLTNLYKTGKDSDGNLDKGQDIYYVHSSGGSSGAIRWSWNTTYNYNSENKIMFACHDTDPAQYTVFTSSNDHSLVRGTYDEWVSGTYEGKIHTFAAPGSGVPIWDEVTTTGATKKWYGITSSADGTKLAAIAFGGNIWTSSTSGATWTEVTVGDGTNNWYGITSSTDGTKLAALVLGGNIWTSSNSGATWTEAVSYTHLTLPTILLL